jgi:hypothetical protein
MAQEGPGLEALLPIRSRPSDPFGWSTGSAEIDEFRCARHLSSSLRELFTQVLHRLAPDKAVQGWTSNPEHYDQGGRRAGHDCSISAEHQFGDFSVVVEADVAAVLKFLGLFQGDPQRSK